MNPVQQPASNSDARKRAAERLPTYGMCLSCSSVDVALIRATGVRDLSHIGEHPSYPTGYGCEVCA